MLDFVCYLLNLSFVRRLHLGGAIEFTRVEECYLASSCGQGIRIILG